MTPAYPVKACSLPTSEPGALLRAIYAAERLLAVLALIILAPVGLTIAFAIYAISKQGPVVAHNRAGWRGSPLPMLKFRTMWEPGGPAVSPFFAIEHVNNGDPAAKTIGDLRVKSRFASFCRRYSLDELPQLIHVARGEMSFVGPRPVTERELEEFYGDSTEEVLSIRPGLTGLWQTMGRSRLTYAQRKRLDLMFVRKLSAGLYLRILLRSIPKVLTGAGAC